MRVHTKRSSGGNQLETGSSSGIASIFLILVFTQEMVDFHSRFPQIFYPQGELFCALMMQGIHTPPWSLTLIIPGGLDPTRAFHLSQRTVYKCRVDLCSVETELFQIIQQGIPMRFASVQ